MILAQGQHYREQTNLRTLFETLTTLAGPPPRTGLKRQCRSQQYLIHAERRRPRSRGAQLAARADGDGQADGSKGLFGFVTDNASSRSAIQQERLPSSESDVGRISARLKDKGKDYGDFWGARATGSSDRYDEFTWFIREIGDKSMDAQRPPTLFLHGVPSSSWSFVRVLDDLDKRGVHAYAPDWIGFGYSEKPQPRYGFNYTEQEFHTALDNMLEDKNISRPLYLVAHGFITGQYAVTWALAHKQAVAKLVIMDVPLSPEAKLPARLQPLRFPLVGEFAAQDCLIAERTLESGTPYVMDIDDAEIYRYPYLTSSTAGFALQETVKRADMRALGSRISAGLAAGSWDIPTLILTGEADKFLKVDDGKAVAAGNPIVVTARSIEAAGHQPHEDYPQLVIQALTTFLK